MIFVGNINRHILSVVSFFALVMLLSAGIGCTKKAGVSDEVEREQPEMKQARALEESGDFAGARGLYESILDRNPTMARAHFELASLLDKKGDDYIGAIYHYRRYLSLRPDTEKKAMIEEHIRTGTLGVVGTLFTNQASILVRMGEVEAENNALKIRAANLQSQAVQSRAAAAALRAKYGIIADKASQSVEAIVFPVTAPKSLGKLVRVEPRDTLKKMASRYYGDQGRWREIYEANRKKMKSPGDLRVGQMIFVPEKDKGATL